MSTSATQLFEADVDIRNTQKKPNKIVKRMSTSVTQRSEADVNIRNNKKKIETDVDIRNSNV